MQTRGICDPLSGMNTKSRPDELQGEDVRRVFESILPDEILDGFVWESGMQQRSCSRACGEVRGHDATMVEEARANGKYAVLLTGIAVPQGFEPYRFASGLLLRRFELEHELPTKAVEFLRTRYGEKVFETWKGEQLAFLLTALSDQSEILDDENLHLLARLNDASWALLLSEFFSSQCPSPLVQFSGAATLQKENDAPPTLVDWRSLTPLLPVRRPYHWRLLLEARRRSVGMRNPWPKDRWWERCDKLEQELHEAGRFDELPTLLKMGFLAYQKAVQESYLGFSIPNLVRAMEVVLAVPAKPQASAPGHPPGKTTIRGGRLFAARGNLFGDALLGDAFLGWKKDATVIAELERLYAHRNDCVHGKVPFGEARSGRDDESGMEELDGEELARSEYVAERLARHMLRVALTHPQRDQIFADRESLEAHWQDGDAHKTWLQWRWLSQASWRDFGWAT